MILRWLLRLFGGLIGWPIVLVCSLLASTLYHLDTQLGRTLVRDILNPYLSEQMAGRLGMGTIKQLRLWRTIVNDTYVYDPDGTPIIFGKTVELGIDPLAALIGNLHFTYANLNIGWVQLIDNGKGSPTFIDTFEPPPKAPQSTHQRAAKGKPLHSIVDNMNITRVDLYGDLLGLENLHVNDMHVRGRMEFTRIAQIEVWSATGNIVKPFPFKAKLDNLVGIVYTDARGVRLLAEATKGPEHVAAEIHYAPPQNARATTPYNLELFIRLDPIEALTLKQVGFDWASSLKGDIQGWTRLWGPNEQYQLSADLTTDGGPVDVHGTLPVNATADIEISTPGADLSQFIKGAPSIEADGKVRFRIDPNTPDIIDIDLDMHGFEYDKIFVPALVAKTRLYPDAIDLLSVKTQYAGGKLNLDGHIAFKGTSAIHAYGDIPEIGNDRNIQKYAPGIKGSAQFDIIVRQSMNGMLDTRGWINIERLDYGIIGASTLRLEGRLRGNPKRPILDLELNASKLQVAGYLVGQGTTTLIGGPSGYRIQGRFDAQNDRRADFSAGVKVVNKAYRLNVETIKITAANRWWEGSVQNVFLDPNRGISFQRIEMGNGPENLEASGEWNFNGPDHIVANLKNFDLSVLKILYPESSPKASGNLDLYLEFRSNLQKQLTILAEGTLRNADLYDISPIDADYLIQVDPNELKLNTQVQIEKQEQLSLHATGMLDSKIKNIKEMLLNGIYQISLATNELDLSWVKRWMPSHMPTLEGKVNINAALSGSFFAPNFKGNAQILDLSINTWSSLNLFTRFKYNLGALSTRVSLSDEDGELAEAEGSFLIDFAHLLESPQQTLRTLSIEPWHLSARIPPRKLNALPLSLTSSFAPDADKLQMSVSLTLAGGAFKTRGDLHASFEWGLVDGLGICGSRAMPRAFLRAKLENDETTATFNVLTDKRRSAWLHASAHTPLNQWLQALKIHPLPIMNVSAKFDETPTEKLPYLCRYIAGPLFADLKANDLFGKDPEFDLSIKTPAIRARRIEPATRLNTLTTVVNTPPASTTLQTQYKNGIGTLDNTTQWWNGGSSEIHARVPIIWNGEHKTPTLPNHGKIQATADFYRMPLKAVLAWMADTIGVEGTINGHVVADGSVQKPDLSGNLTLSDSQVSFRKVGQTLDNISGQFVFDDDGIEIKKLTATDSKGDAVVNGRIQLDRFRAKQLDLTLQDENFPIRQEGIIRARMDGNLQLLAKVVDQKVQGEVHIRDMTLSIPPQRSTPQELSKHNDIFFVNEPRKLRKRNPYQIEIHIVSEKRFWVRSTDQNFAAQASTDLQVGLSKIFSLQGSVRLYQGHFEIFGKRFNVQSASMNFDGNSDINPSVNLIATHLLRGSSNSVTVTVLGKLNNPQIEFTSTVPTQNESQVIALLVTGTAAQQQGLNASTQDATTQTTDFLSGVAAGVLSGALRSEFGNYAPTLGIQSGAAEDTSTQVQVGFNMDALIPDEVRQIIRGLYVEGQFVTRSNEGNRNTTAQAQRPGFLIEALWPLNFVTTGVFSPPSNWSIDLTWEP